MWTVRVPLTKLASYLHISLAEISLPEVQRSKAYLNNSNYARDVHLYDECFNLDHGEAQLVFANVLFMAALCIYSCTVHLKKH